MGTDPVVTHTLAIPALLGVAASTTKVRVVFQTLVPVSTIPNSLPAWILILSTDSPGAGGFSGSGDATGGDAGPRPSKRAYDGQTAGGNAYSGNSASTSSGSVSNVGDDDSTVDNMAASSESNEMIFLDEQ